MMFTWVRLVGIERQQPDTGDYPDWKDQIATDCGKQCIYCCIGSARYGGLTNFHVEHYRPKHHFGDLRKTISNLFLACGICNRFKSDDWPNEPAEDHSLVAYPDPATTDYNELFDHIQGDCSVRGRHVSSRYVVERLYLNRPQLRRERRLAYLRLRLVNVRAQLEQLEAQVQNVLREGSDQRMRDVAGAFMKLQKMTITCQGSFDDICQSDPYSLAEIRRK